jgi:hypothetical protein
MQVTLLLPPPPTGGNDSRLILPSLQILSAGSGSLTIDSISIEVANFYVAGAERARLTTWRKFQN